MEPVSKQRSDNMSRIGSHDTAPEMLVRSMLHRKGFRYTVTSVNNRELPGKPDLVLPKYRRVIFVHGCFWHAHEGCKYFQLPATRRAWWKAKLHGNRERDKVSQRKLMELGWRVLIVWECAVKRAADRPAAGDTLADTLRDDDSPLVEISNPDGSGC